MRQLKSAFLAPLILAAGTSFAQGVGTSSSTESPAQPSSQGTTRSSGPALGVSPQPGTNATGSSGSSATVTPDGNRELGTTVRGGSDSATTSDHATSRTWGGVGSTGGATGTGTSSGTSDAHSESAAGGPSQRPGESGAR